MKAEIIAVGTELLSPDHIDTNSLYMTGELNGAGWEVRRKTVVGDGLEDIAEAIQAALNRSELVILSGGLGPTEDDRTRAAAAMALGRKMTRNDEILEKLHRRFASYGFKMNKNNERQADVIDGAEVLENHFGTAPGQWIEDSGRYVALLPGPPRELKPIFETFVLPKLRAAAGGRRMVSKLFYITGISESTLDSRIAPIYTAYPDIDVTILAGTGHGSVRLSKWFNAGESPAKVEELAARIQAELGDAVFSTTGETMAEVAGRMLRQSGKTLAVAESCTSGMLGMLITRVPGSSDYFRGGALCYSNDAKMKLCGVPPETLANHGAVSAETAEALARGVRSALSGDLGISITGIAGPDGGSAEKPVGLVYFGLSDGINTEIRHRVMPGDRESVRERSAYFALSMIRDYLLGTSKNSKIKACGRDKSGVYFSGK
jgi:nicotinamide-nucleotide amidase